MEKIDASTLLRINLGASVTEIEAAYRKRRDEVRKRFEAARKRSTRTQCECEFTALKEARITLLAELDDVTIELVAPPAKPVATPIEPVGTLFERLGFGAIGRCDRGNLAGARFTMVLALCGCYHFRESD